MRSQPAPIRARLHRIALWTFCSAVLGGCIIGGTGSDTENGVAEKGVSVSSDKNEVSIRGVSSRVVDGEGRPVKGVRLFLYEPGFRPDYGTVAPSLLSGTKLPITDTNGYALFDLAGAGKFVVEGVSAGKTLFYDTLAVPDTQSAALFTFFIRAAKNFQGRVKLASGMHIDSGYVFITGTARWDKVDAAGYYDLGSLPADAAHMGIGIRYAASPTAVKEVTRTDTTKQGTVSVLDSTTVSSCTDLNGEAAKSALAQTGNPSNAPGLDTLGGGGSDTVTTKVSTAAQSCDSLASGTVINVKQVEKANSTAVSGLDTASVPVLVLAPTYSNSFSQERRVVPYGECVASAGTEVIDFQLEVRGSAEGSDILVGDVADKCLNP